MQNGLKFKRFYFKDGNPYAGGVGILQDGTPVWVSAENPSASGSGKNVHTLKVSEVSIKDFRATAPAP